MDVNRHRMLNEDELRDAVLLGQRIEGAVWHIAAKIVAPRTESRKCNILRSRSLALYATTFGKRASRTENQKTNGVGTKLAKLDKKYEPAEPEPAGTRTCQKWNWPEPQQDLHIFRAPRPSTNS